jgi:hypothetical protein
MDRKQIEAMVTRERPGWRVVDVIEVNDESGANFQVTLEGSGAARTTLLVTADGRIGGEEGRRG